MATAWNLSSFIPDDSLDPGSTPRSAAYSSASPFDTTNDSSSVAASFTDRPSASGALGVTSVFSLRLENGSQIGDPTLQVSLGEEYVDPRLVGGFILVEELIAKQRTTTLATLDVAPATVVPVPTGLPLLLGAAGALALITRRRRR